jgi:tripartite-type tricarboxylate transporter receptor subunit TctC
MKSIQILRRGALLSAALAVAGLGLFAQSASAQEWPTRTVRLILPYPVGGGPDGVARLLADKLGRKWGKPVVVENRPGGNGFIAIDAFKRGAKDGHDLIQLDSVHLAAYPYMFKKLPYEVDKDFEPLAPLFKAYLFFTVGQDSKYKKVSDIIADAKANPGKLNYASSGNGSIQHIAGELFKQLTGTFVTHIPYRGSGPAVQDLMAGQVDIFITTPAGVVSQIQGGRLKGIAVTSKQRLASLPGVPTAAEQGLNGYELDSWFALYAPAGTPAEVVQQLNTEINKILAGPEARKKAEDSGTDVAQMTPQQLGEFTKKELEHWGRVIRGAKITLE